MNSKALVILLAVCVVFAILRFTLPVGGFQSEDIFKDLAHVFVGGMFGAAIATKHKELWAMAVGLTLAEVVAALTRG